MPVVDILAITAFLSNISLAILAFLIANIKTVIADILSSSYIFIFAFPLIKLYCKGSYSSSKCASNGLLVVALQAIAVLVANLPATNMLAIIISDWI